MRPPRFDLRVAVGRNLTLTSLSLPLTRQDHDKTPVAVGGHLRALDMWIGRNAIHGSTFWSSRSRRKPGLTHTASRSQARITLNDLSRATSLAARVVRHSRRRARPSRALRDKAPPEILRPPQVPRPCRIPRSRRSGSRSPKIWATISGEP